MIFTLVPQASGQRLADFFALAAVLTTGFPQIRMKI